MAREIERKYLLKGDEWRTLRPSSVQTLAQGYVPETAEVYISAREPDGIHVRICTDGRAASVIINDGPANRNFREVFHLTGYDAQTTRLHLGRELVMRVRTCTENQAANAAITIKQATENPEVRTECEARLPAEQAEYLLETVCADYVSKTRHIVPHQGHEWHVDVFHGPLEGLIVAEIEVATESGFDDLCPFPGVTADVTALPGMNNRALGRAGIPEDIRAKISEQ